jgi:HEAT repeat protein
LLSWFDPDVEELKSRRDVKGLLKALRRPKIAAKAAEALGELRERSAVGPLLDLLRDAPSDAWIRALGDIGDPAAAGAIRPHLLNRMPWVRWAARGALAQLGEKQWRELAAKDGTRDSVARFDEDLRALIGCHDPLLLDAAMAAMQLPDSATDHFAALLAPFDDPRAIAYVIQSMKPRPSVPPVLCRHHGAAAVDRLLAYMAEGLGNLEWIAQSLGTLGDPRAVTTLIAVFGQPEAPKAHIARALGALGDVRAVEPLIAALNTPGALPWFADDVAEALGKLGDKRAVPVLLSAIGHHSPTTRRAVGQALARLDDPIWAQRLTGEEEDFERIADYANAAAVRGLVDSLSKGYISTRRAAARALARVAAVQPALLCQHIEQVRALVPQSHDDRRSHYSANDCHEDTHIDNDGIGLSIEPFAGIEAVAITPPPLPAAPTGPAAVASDQSGCERTAAAMICFTCPHPGCGQVIKVPASLAGRRGKCTKCGGILEISNEP